MWFASLWLFLGLLGSPFLAYGQITVTGADGATNAGSPYTTLKAAFDNINLSSQEGNVIVISVTGNTTESASAVLNAGTWTSLTISPSGGVVRTISGNITGFTAPLIGLNGADNVTIDGTTTKNLTLVNTNNTNTVLRFINGASNNVVRNVKIQSRNAGTTSGAVLFSTSTTGANTNNLIDNCEISGDGTGFPANGIYSVGSTSPNNNTNNTISNCFIYDYFLAGGATNGIFLSTANDAWTITGNRFYQTATRTYTTSGNTHRAIQIGSGSGYTITNNIIGYANSGGTGTYTMAGAVATIFTPIELTLGTTASNVRGNKIKNISLFSSSNSTTGIFRGIVVTAGNVNIGGTGTGEGNEIGDDASNGNISVTSSVGGAAILIGGIVNTGTTNTVNIQGNKVGGITGVGSASVTYSMVGIQTASFGSITNNTIGSTTLSNSIFNSTTASASTAIPLYGIFINGYTGASNILIDQNIIANLSSTHAGSNTSAITRGIYSTGTMTGTLTVTNNQVYNISTSSTQNNTGRTGAVLGGISVNGASTVSISQNQVYNLSQVGGGNASNILGIVANYGAGTHTINRNLVYDLTSTSTGVASIYGVNLTGATGTMNVANNAIRLGQGVTLAHSFYGLYDGAGNNNFYYNTSYIGGTGVTGGAKTFAMANDAGSIRTIQNNIFVNVRSNSTTNTAKHYAYTATASGTLTSDYNIIFANGTDGTPIGRGGSGGTPTPFTTYKDYRVSIYSALEINSAFGNPQLNNPTATIPDLSLALLSPAFQTGTPIGAVTNDYANLTRNVTTPNIGAYETVSSVANASTDISTPAFSYTALSNISSSDPSPTRTILVTISDRGTGVPTSGASAPTMWYRNQTDASAWVRAIGVLQSGTGRNGVWQFTFTNASIPTVSVGDVIQYYFVAQDQATTPNIWFAKLDATVTQGSDFTVQGTPPTTPDNYTIIATQYRTAGAVSFASSTNWESSPDGTTWSASTFIPGATDGSITIRNTHTATIGANITLDELTVESGGILQVNTGVTLTVADGAGTDLTVAGTLDVQGTGTLAGAGSFSLASGATLRTGNVNGLGAVGLTGTETFTAGANYVFNGSALQTLNSPIGFSACGLTVNNSAGLQLNEDIAVTCNLTLQLGDLDLKNKNINLGTSGTLVEDRANNHLLKESTTSLSESNKGGYIRVTNRSTTGTLAEIAGLGIHLANAGTVSIDRYHYEGAGIAGGGVLKNYEITGTPSNATMRIEFASDELGGVTPDNTFKLFRYNGTNWVNQGGTWTDAAVDYVELSGITAFSPWTTGSGSGPLPVSLLKFEVQRLDNQRVILNWQTASEINNQGFEIEQSENGADFQKVGFVDGHINSNQIRNYSFVIPNSNAAYYRLKQVDLDGKFEYSPIRLVSAGELMGLLVSPNPATTRVRLRFERGASQEVLQLAIYDAQGRLVWEGKGKLADLETELNRQLPQQANGLLYLRLRSQVGVFEQKVVKY
jgi:hypothetical protein